MSIEYLPNGMHTIMRRRVARFLRDTCAIEKQNATQDKYGQITGAWEVTEADVPCRVLPYQIAREGAQIIGEAERLIDIVEITLPVGTTIQGDYRVTLSTGEQYHIRELRSAATDKLFITVLAFREVEGG